MMWPDSKEILSEEECSGDNAQASNGADLESSGSGAGLGRAGIT